MNSADYNTALAIKTEGADSYPLYVQYSALCNKMYRMFKTYHKSSTLGFDDYKQEAYIYYLKAINYIDFSRISNPETWKFNLVFYPFLQSLNKKLSSRENDPASNPTSLCLDEDRSLDGDNTIEYHIDICSDDSTLATAHEHCLTETYLACLDEDELNVVMGKLSLQSDNATPRLVDIAESLGKNYAWAFRKFTSAKDKFVKQCCS